MACMAGQHRNSTNPKKVRTVVLLRANVIWREKKKKKSSLFAIYFHFQL